MESIIKLVRNSLVDLQVFIDGKCRKERLYLGNKLRKAHIYFQEQKIKVRMAIPSMSISVAGALDFCRNVLKLTEFCGNGGLTKVESICASVHPSDLPNLEAFKALGVNTLTENIPVVQNSDLIFVSVKPSVVGDVLHDVKPVSDGKLFISVAMGVSLKELHKNLSQNARLIRVMPNTPALVQEGCSVFVRGYNSTDGDASVTQKLLESIGTCEEVPEPFLDAITALSGSGPAYVFVMIEALADGGVNMGLPRDLAYRLAAQTVLGSGKLVRDTKEHPGKLKDNVTSPAGSTAAGLSHLEKCAFRSAVAGAVEAATLRCKQISGPAK